MRYRFRPHHFFCSIGFEGKGYSPQFVRNYQAIVDDLRGPEGDLVELEVVSETDSVCSPCPHRRETACESENRIQTLDRGHAQVLGLRTGDILTWAEAKDRLRQRMSVEDHHRVCDPCEWRALGMCERALKKLKDTP